MGKRNEFVVASEKGAAETEVGLMMDKKTHKSFPRKKMMMMMMPHHNHHPLVSNSNTAGLSFGGEEDCGVWDHQSLFCNTSNPAAITCVTDLYNAVGSDFGSELLPKSLHHQQQPYSDHTLSLSSSGGGMVNVNVRFPFTRAQRVELEEQAMIYKYMMASLPVPPQLLVPITKNTSNVARLYPNLVRSLDLASTRNVCPDPEPWRCKRTDGKKWRCSRDVAFNQKYCERHANKARIRSRKPVESNPNFININNNRIRSPRSNVFRKNNSNQSSPYSASNMVSSASAALSHVQPRPMGWFINEETPPAVAGSNSNQEWEQMTQFKLGLKSCSKHENESERQALQAQRPSHDQYDLFCSSPKLGHSEAGLNSSQTQETRHFIDAWSTATSAAAAAAAASERGGGSRIIGEIGTRGFVCSNQKLPFSSLTLSMSRGYETNEENSEKGLGIFGAERENEGGDLKSQWMMNSGSWMMGSPPGGPLAEALCLGIASSSNGCNSNSGSTSCRSSSGDVRQEYDLIN